MDKFSHREFIALAARKLIYQPKILATQRKRKAWIIMAGKDRRHVMLSHPAVAGAGLNRFPYCVQWYASLRAKHQTFTYCRGAYKPQQISKQLSSRAIAR